MAVEYTYDAWGRVLSITGSKASTVGRYNPLRYRGYVYDNETELYYLQSRYYDPAWGRFINADGYASTGQGFAGNNAFAYCNNNPVMYFDAAGCIPAILIAKFAINTVATTAVNIASAYMAAKLLGEDLNMLEMVAWSVIDGVLVGASSVIVPCTHLKQAVGFLQLSASLLHSAMNAAETDDGGALALSTGMTLITAQIPSDTLGNGIDAMVSFAADSVESVINVGRKNANTPTESTDVSYKSPSSTKKPSATDGFTRRYSSTVRGRNLGTSYSRNPRSAYYVG